MGDLFGEKSRLQDLAKKMNLAHRQRDMEFKNREVAFQEELRKKEELVRQKENGMNRARDTVSQLSNQLDRLRESTQTSTEDSLLRQKFNSAQKTLLLTKEKNAELERKIDEQRITIQNAKQQRGPTFAELSDLKEKYERTLRQADEFKKSNQKLMDRLNESKKDRGASGGVEELKKRLDSAMKVAMTNQQDAESLRRTLEEKQREELRLKKDFARVLLELKTIKEQKKPDQAA